MLEGIRLSIRILIDNSNLQYFMFTKQLSCRQVRWSEIFLCFNFLIHYWPNKLGAKRDTLTRKSGDLPKERDGHLHQIVQIVLKPHNLDSPVKKNLVAILLIIESEENLDDPTLK